MKVDINKHRYCCCCCWCPYRMDVDLGGDFEGFLGSLRHHGYTFTVFTPASPTLLHPPFTTHTRRHTPLFTAVLPLLSAHLSHAHSTFPLLVPQQSTFSLHFTHSSSTYSLQTIHLSHSPHTHHTTTLIIYSHIPDASEWFMLHTVCNISRLRRAALIR